MGCCFLCSRSELFRSLDLDTGIDPMFIGPPDGFMDWFDKVLPLSTTSVKDTSSIPDGSLFDLALIWPKNGRYPVDIELSSIKEHLTNDERIWVVIPAGIEGLEEEVNGEDNGVALVGPPILLSTEHEIYKLKV